MTRSERLLAVLCLALTLTACARDVTLTPTSPPPTASPTVRLAPTCTETPRPTSTARPTSAPKPTSKPTPTPTPQPTAPPRATPTPELISGPGPRIFAFEATPDSGLEIGDEVRLTWEAQGERAELSWYDHNGQLEGWREVSLSDSTTVKLQDQDPVADHWVDFELYVVRESDVYTYTEQRLRVTLVCRLSWFFTPAPEGCPSEEPDGAPLLAQHFERGLILGDATQARIYLDEPGQLYLGFGLRLLPQADLGGESPPAGLFLPAPEFSGVWAGLVPGQEEIRERLGWAMGTAVAFESARQCAQPEEPGPPRDCFQLGPDGQVYYAQIEGEPEAIWLDNQSPLSTVQGTWELWPAAWLDDS